MITMMDVIIMRMIMMTVTIVMMMMMMMMMMMLMMMMMMMMMMTVTTVCKRFGKRKDFVSAFSTYDAIACLVCFFATVSRLILCFFAQLCGDYSRSLQEFFFDPVLRSSSR